MLTVAALFLTMTVAVGLTMAGLHFSGKVLPFWLAITHGTLAVISITVLTFAEVTRGAKRATGVALAIIEIAALGGFALFVTYLCGPRMPSPLIFTHGLSEICGYALLLSFLLIIKNQKAAQLMAQGAQIREHPIHPPLTDFPLALLSASLLWDIIGALGRDPAFWWPPAYWSLAVGLIVAVPTVVTGLIDYSRLAVRRRIQRRGTWHMSCMLAALALFIASLLIRGGPALPKKPRLINPAAVSALGFGVLTIGGWFGRDLVFRYNIGSKSRSKRRLSREKVWE